MGKVEETPYEIHIVPSATANDGKAENTHTNNCYYFRHKPTALATRPRSIVGRKPRRAMGKGIGMINLLLYIAGWLAGAGTVVFWRRAK